MSKVRSLTLMSIFTMAFSWATAQQDAHFTMFMFNPTFYNPAYVGADGLTRLQLQSRFQWAGYQATFDDGGAPTTLMASAAVPLSAIKGSLGVHYVNDHLGPAGNQEVQLSYAYKTYINDNLLSIGVRGGLYNRYVDFGMLRARDAGDPLVPTGRIAQTQPDIALGVLYDTYTYYIGLGINHVNKPKFSFGNSQATNPLQPNLYLMGGYRFEPAYGLEVEPLVLVKSPMNFSPKSLSFEAGALATYNEQFFGGFTYRWQDAFAGIAGVNLLDNSLRIAYSFDFTVGGLDAKAPTSHEILLSYNLPAPHFGKKSIVRTPRFRY